ncbi:hypothetical protein C8D95_107202 [Silicimonas algicola]|uniref:Uncharacterized protein n=1 Tax=Silicimonas algicola TaxID=1826607 RepID=A0A316G6F2_9RHOB|nr:hypothetical protein C8D95_107202 [Silicimonas algicola]
MGTRNRQTMLARVYGVFFPKSVPFRYPLLEASAKLPEPPQICGPCRGGTPYPPADIAHAAVTPVRDRARCQSFDHPPGGGRVNLPSLRLPDGYERNIKPHFSRTRASRAGGGTKVHSLRRPDRRAGRKTFTFTKWRIRWKDVLESRLPWQSSKALHCSEVDRLVRLRTCAGCSPRAERRNRNDRDSNRHRMKIQWQVRVLLETSSVSARSDTVGGRMASVVTVILWPLRLAVSVFSYSRPLKYASMRVSSSSTDLKTVVPRVAITSTLACDRAPFQRLGCQLPGVLARLAQILAIIQ